MHTLLRLIRWRKIRTEPRLASADLPRLTHLAIADSATQRRVEQFVRERQNRWRLLC
jgi:hypothetical protein